VIRSGRTAAGAAAAEAIGDERADEVAGSGRDDGEGQAEPPALDADACGHEGHLAGDRDAGALGHHQEEDADDAEVVDEARHNS